MPHLTKFKVKKTSVYQISNHTYTRSELLNQPSSVEKNSIQIAKFTYVCYMCSLKINVLPYLLREKIVIYCTYIFIFIFFRLSSIKNQENYAVPSQSCSHSRSGDYNRRY